MGNDHLIYHPLLPARPCCLRGSAEAVPVSVYVGSSANLRDLTDLTLNGPRECLTRIILVCTRMVEMDMILAHDLYQNSLDGLFAKSLVAAVWPVLSSQRFSVKVGFRIQRERDRWRDSLELGSRVVPIRGE